MRICLIGRSDLSQRPASIVLARRLDAVGHDVVIVCGDGKGTAAPVPVIGVPRRLPTGGGRVGRALRTIQPDKMVRRSLDNRLVAAATSTNADLFYPAGPTDVGLARQAASPSALVMTQPHWKSAGKSDLAWVAPTRPEFTISPGGPGLPFPDHELSPPSTDLTVAIAYRRTGTNPGHYLETALQRAGITVVALDSLNWEEASHADAVVVVESPLPRLEHVGANPGVPVLYWVHHGEHHMANNLRLARHYEADAVLMAHSLHLAHRFPVPVHRFPFGIAPELGTEWIPFAERELEVALIGSGTESKGGRYRRRASLVHEARRLFGEGRVRAGRGLSPSEIADVYRNTKVVINDCGDRHLPITMRVMESIGSGSLLLTDPAPGLDSLFEPQSHYLEIEDDFGSQLAAIVADPTIEAKALAAHEHGLANHLYDHRVGRLSAIIAATSRREHSAPARSDFETVLERDADVETIAGLPDADMVVDHVADLRPVAEIPEAGVDAVYVARPDEVDAARISARIFVYGPHDALPTGEDVGNGFRRLDVRQRPSQPKSIGGASYRVPG